jgi:hypothetical protein
MTGVTKDTPRLPDYRERSKANYTRRLPTTLRSLLTHPALKATDSVMLPGALRSAADEIEALWSLLNAERLSLASVEAAKNDYARIAFERGQEIERLTQAHDRRVAELLEANNREVERRRAAEAALRQHRCSQLPAVGSFP